MRSISWLKCGDWNLRGKKTRCIMAGKYVEEVLVNHRDRELAKLAEREMREGMVGG